MGIIFKQFVLDCKIVMMEKHLMKVFISFEYCWKIQ